MQSKRASHQPQSEAPATILSPRNPEDPHWEMQQVQLAIARRAYESFEARGCEHGHDWEDWFRAESELLSPVSVSMQESADRISVHANVLGRKEVSATATERGLPLWKEIPNQNLKASDIPSSTASWDQLKRFAGSFNAYRSLELFDRLRANKDPRDRRDPGYIEYFYLEPQSLKTSGTLLKADWYMGFLPRIFETGPDFVFADTHGEVDSHATMDLPEGKKLALDGLGLSELRAILFLHWRGLRHAYCGGEPSPREMACTRELIEAIRRKV